MMGSMVAIYFPGGWEWIVILVVALLIFGKRLPEVGKSLGKGIVEFKKGLKGMKEEMDEVDREVKDAVRAAEREAEQAAERKKLEAQEESRLDGAAGSGVEAAKNKAEA